MPASSPKGRPGGLAATTPSPGGQSFADKMVAMDPTNTLVAGENAVDEHLARTREEGAQVFDQVAAEDRERMEQFLASFPVAVPATVTAVVAAPVLPASAVTVAGAPPTFQVLVEENPALFRDVDLEISPAPARGKGRGRSKKAVPQPAGVPVISPTHQPVLPNVLVEFLDDGRRQAIRAHAATLSADGEGLCLLTQRARHARYFPKANSVLEISVQSGEKVDQYCVYCAGDWVHADFPEHGMATSTYRVIAREDMEAMRHERRLAEARALLAKAESNSRDDHATL